VGASPTTDKEAARRESLAGPLHSPLSRLRASAIRVADLAHISPLQLAGEGEGEGPQPSDAILDLAAIEAQPL
jgi:hypothetical protein